MQSLDLFERAKQVIPGGVNSPVRGFGAVGGSPVYVEKGAGSRLYTADGNELIDFCCSWGPLILGHAHSEILEAVNEAVKSGTSFGANTRREVEFAELLCEHIPYVEMLRLINSGTEAVMTALRLARGYTGRDKILKFDGCYHGHTDSMLVSAGSGLLTSGTASSSGVPSSVTKDTLVAPYNDLDAVQNIVREHGDNIAAIIVEPIAGNMGLVMPSAGFLEGLRKVADSCGAVLVFDEVITGFRLGPTTYGSLCGVTPDLTCLGKIIGGGFPIGALGGKRDIMESLAPLGDVYQAGTLSGNPVALAAGLATLRVLIERDPYPAIEKLGCRLSDGLNSIANSIDVPMHCVQQGGMFTVFFTDTPITNLTTTNLCDKDAFAEYFRAMLRNHIYLPPSQFEVGFISAAHTASDIDQLLDAASLSI